MLALFATSPKGIEDLLAAELAQLGGKDIAPSRAGVAFSGTLETAYRVCLWSRLASRVLLQLGKHVAVDADGIYAAAGTVRWAEHLGREATLAVDFVGRHDAITHSHYGAVRVKDAIVDQLRDAAGRRPSVDAKAP